jgi:DNA-binding NarL/FixJ family response regulator
MPSFPPTRVVRVLIADDDHAFAESLTVALTKGEQVDVVGMARDGREAVELALQLQPHVILMDLRMPGIDGLEATRLIREAGVETQILIVSGTEEETGSEAAAEAGADAFLKKDSDPEELKHIVLEVASLAAALGTQKRA